MKRIYKSCVAVLLLLAIECWSFLIVPIGEMLPKIHCKEYGIALIWEWIW